MALRMILDPGRRRIRTRRFASVGETCRNGKYGLGWNLAIVQGGKAIAVKVMTGPVIRVSQPGMGQRPAYRTGVKFL